MADTSVTKVGGERSPVGRMGQRYLASGVRLQQSERHVQREDRADNRNHFVRHREQQEPDEERELAGDIEHVRPPRPRQILPPRSERP